jgi:hypothetical protein
MERDARALPLLVTGPAIRATARPGADPNQLAEHAHAVAQQADLRGAAVMPFDRDFDDS